jgi:hypothetical protein
MARKRTDFLTKNEAYLTNTGIKDEIEAGRSALPKEFDLETIILRLAQYFKLPGKHDSCNIKNDPLLAIQLAIEIYEKIPVPNMGSFVLAIAHQMNNRVIFSSGVRTGTYNSSIHMGETRIEIPPDGKLIVLH